MQNRTFFRLTGASLAAGGLATILVNAFLTPLLPRSVPFVVKAASTIFLLRQSASGVAAVLLLFGCVGLYLRQSARLGRFGAIAFPLAFLGTALLLATEWNEIFTVRDLAARAPQALETLEKGPGPTLYDLGAIIAITIFTGGWIALAVSTLRAGMLSRPSAVLVLVGFFAIPILGAALPGRWGAMIGNAVLGSCWIGLGWDLHRTGGAGPGLARHPAGDV